MKNKRPARRNPVDKALRVLRPQRIESRKAYSKRDRRLDIKAILRDPQQRAELIAGAADFICQLERIR
jgi:hypothetical protein